jgi:CRP-like cAMP-binding protein
MLDHTITTRDLANIHLFSSLAPGELEKVAQSSRLIHLPEGKRLFQQDQPFDQFFFVRRGQIKLFRTSLHGDEKVIEIVSAGQTFAEAIMFMDRKTYPVSAEALMDTEVIGFDSKVFTELLRQSVDTCFRVMGELSVWLRRHLHEIDALTLQNATLRFVNYLSREMPENCEEATEIHLSAPKYVIASRLSVKPESLSRILHSLQEQGLITVDGQNIVIHDPQGLRAFGQ